MKRAPLLWFCLCVLALQPTAEAQSFYESYTFTTPAGIAPGSADGSGTSARFREPAGATQDSSGNIFISDTWNQTIRKITPAGRVTTFAGTAGFGGGSDGKGSAVSFWFPTGIAADASDNLYVSSASS